MFSLLAIGCKEYLTKTHHSEQSSREREEKSSSVACPIIKSNKAVRRDQMQQAFQLLKSGRSSNEYKKTNEYVHDCKKSTGEMPSSMKKQIKFTYSERKRESPIVDEFKSKVRDYRLFRE